MRPLPLSLALGASLLASPLPSHARVEAPPALDVPAATRAKMTVCTDGKSHYVAIGPDEQVTHHMYYGDGKLMSEVTDTRNNMLSGTDFLEPRYPNPTANPDFRGIDWRLVSSVQLDEAKHTCKLSCGTRAQALSVMPAAEAQALLGKARFQKSPNTREAYALARDDHGVYYYVDRGNTPATQNNFRVFVGRKGAMKLQKMKDVASDSEGEVFSTASGDLRFVTSHEEKKYSWVRGAKKLELLALPVRDNLTLIYTTLGVYTGERLGNPCDDL